MAKIIGAGSLIVDITGYAAHLPVHGEINTPEQCAAAILQAWRDTRGCTPGETPVDLA